MLDSFIQGVIAIALIFAPTHICLAWLMRNRRLWKEQSRAPFNDLRRPPGEYLRQKIEAIDEKLLEYILLLVGWPAALIFMLLISRPKGQVAIIYFLLTVVGTTAAAWILGRKINKVARERWNYQLGWDGERRVAEELNLLLVDRFSVFHDLQFDKYNIDHVVVGAHGVFAIETKTRRKPVDSAGTKKYVVYFENDFLDWGLGRETDDLKQAALNAETLSRWLSSAVGRSVPVTAILTIPGWWVEKKSPAQKVHVLNPKTIGGFCKSRPITFDAEMIQRICHQLDQKCRIEIA